MSSTLIFFEKKKLDGMLFDIDKFCLEKKIKAKVFFDKNLITKLSYVFPFMILKNHPEIQNHLEINLRKLDKLLYDLKRLFQNLKSTQNKKKFTEWRYVFPGNFKIKKTPIVSSPCQMGQFNTNINYFYRQNQCQNIFFFLELDSNNFISLLSNQGSKNKIKMKSETNLILPLNFRN